VSQLIEGDIMKHKKNDLMVYCYLILAACLLAGGSAKSASPPKAKQKRAPNQQYSDIVIAPLEPDVDPRVFESSAYRVYKYGEQPAQSRSEIAPVAVRDKVFASVGLGPELKDFDELEKDFLFRRARVRTFAEMTELYGQKIDAAKLLSLMKKAKQAQWK
jgi:hypothetical protein